MHGFSLNGPVIAFDGEGSWSFDNDFARNVVIFGVNHISLSYYVTNENNGNIFDKLTYVLRCC